MNKEPNDVLHQHSRRLEEEVAARSVELTRLNADLERRVTECTAQLAAANKELDAFSYSVAHDLRGPLSAIDGFSGLLEKELGRMVAAGGDVLRAPHHVSRIRASVKNMSELIEALLMLSRLSRVKVERLEVSISQEAQLLADALRSSEPQRNAMFDIEPGMLALCDVKLLRQVLANLLGNAWKFSSSKPQTRISFRCQPHASGAPVYSIQDNGVGFDMAQSELLFCAFQRLHSDAQFAGSGIGLATVHRIISRHGGRIWAESVVGQGTTFSFTLEEDAASTSA
ncbi:MAG: hypothetical protein H7332_12430 [Bdellovibrionales bacterium]|nr:hypothetical protein [Ramlibacter sp.]